MIQPWVEKVAAWATGPEREEEILRAREDFRRLTGDFHDDDRSFETRMAAFLEYFLFDRPLDGRGVPPTEAWLEDAAATIDDGERPRFEALTQSLHGVFEIRKLGTKHGLRIRELLTEKDYEIYERRELVGLKKGDVFDARIVPWDDESWVFAGTFLYHPAEARKPIRKEARRRRKEGGEAASPLQFAWDLARMLLKFERYRNVPVENIYKFD